MFIFTTPDWLYWLRGHFSFCFMNYSIHQIASFLFTVKDWKLLPRCGCEKLAWHFMVNGLWEFLSFFSPPWIRENLCDELIFTAVPTSRLSITVWIFHWNIHLLYFYVADWKLYPVCFPSSYIYWCLQKSAEIWVLSLKTYSWSLISGVLPLLSDSTVFP